MRAVAVIFGLLAALTLGACSSSHSASSVSSVSSQPASSTASVSPSPSGRPSVSDGEATELPGFPTAPEQPELPTAGSQAAVSQFITAVFTDAQTDWAGVFTSAGVAYTPARLRLFSAAVDSG
jgi:predicted metalloprotease